MGGGKDNHVDKGYYPPIVYAPPPPFGAHGSYPPVAYPYHYPPQSLGYPPPPGSYTYPPSICPSHGHNGYPPSGYPTYGRSAYPHNNSYPGHHGYGNVGPLLVGGACAAGAATAYGGAATAYGVHHLTHGHYHHGHHLGHFGRYKHRPCHGNYGKSSMASMESTCDLEGNMDPKSVIAKTKKKRFVGTKKKTRNHIFYAQHLEED